MKLATKIHSPLRRLALCAALLFAASVAHADEPRDLNPGNRGVVAKTTPGAVDLRWADQAGPVRAWWVYHAKGTIAGGNNAKNMCERRPNARKLNGRDSRSTRIGGLAHLSTYTIMVEAEYRGELLPEDNPKCDYAALIEVEIGGVKRQLVDNPQVESLFLYGVHNGIVVDNDKDIAAWKWHIYHKRGRHTPEYMCLYRPNAIHADGRRKNTAYKRIGGLENGQIYTVMVEIEVPWKYDIKKQCVYSMGYMRPDPRGVPGLVVRNINPGFANTGYIAGDGTVLLRWPKPRGEVNGYRIYHIEGEIQKDDNHAQKMCNNRPNRIDIRDPKQRKQLQHLVTGLPNKQPRTFLVEVDYRHANRYDCAYLYHIALTPNPKQVTAAVNNNPHHHETSATPGSQRVHLRWKGKKGARAWHIYYTKGTIEDARELCTHRPNAIILRDAKATEYTVRNLEQDTPYTFLVEIEFGNQHPPQIRAHCDYAYHAYATTRPDWNKDGE